MWEVDVTLVEAWLLGLDQDSYQLVVAALELLEERGPQLGRPLADSVKTSRHKNMKELRPGSKGVLNFGFCTHSMSNEVPFCLLLVTSTESGISGTG